MTSHSTQAESRYVEANGQRLHYRQWPADEPPLIFLHGVTSSATSWEKIAPEFAADYSVMAFDLRGHGLSSKPASGYSVAGHYAADIIDFLRSHVAEPATLIGHSLGAVVTAPVAATVPDKVRYIVMEDPPAFVPSEDPFGTRERFEPVLDLKRMPYARVKKLSRRRRATSRPPCAAPTTWRRWRSRHCWSSWPAITPTKPMTGFPRWRVHPW